jgi:hypothetical protein
MKVTLLAAATLAVLLGAAHSYLGERFILAPLLRRKDLPVLFGGTEFTRRTLRFAWHLTTVAWVGLALLLAVLASPGGGDPRTQVPVIACTFAASAAVSLIGSRGRHLSWIVFIAIAGLAGFSLR